MNFLTTHNKKRAHLLIFGRTPKLSLLELQALFPKFSGTLLRDDVLLLDLISFDAEKLMNIVGGVTKIAKVVAEGETLSSQILAKLLMQNGKTHVTFGLSGYGLEMAKVEHEEVKKILQDTGISARFILPSGASQLSSVVIEKQKVSEIIIVKKNKSYLFAKTIAVQPFRQWSKRDYDRPYVDPKRGMLPPKIARIMVNVAAGMGLQSKIIVDPFCGTGTIISEALLRGLEARGFDQSPEAVAKASANIAWLTSVYHDLDQSGYKISVGDATHISNKLESESIDAIVTEPYLGPASLGERGPKAISTDRVKNIIKGLEKLYLGCLRDWHRVLKSEGKIVIAFPKIILNNTIFFVKKVVDTCENLGYTIQAGPIEYSRPQAVVRREIYVFKKTKLD